MKPFTKLQVKDYELARVQDAILNALNPVLMLPLVDGHLIQAISIGTGVTLVPHGLSRLPVFWILARNDTNSVIWETPSQTTTKFLALQASVPTTISLWVG